MSNFGFEDMQAIQKELQERYLARWGGLSPQKGRDSLLWMMIEAGEVADIIKKLGDEKIMDDPETRHDFIEEMCDVMMYFNDVMLCYSITPDELAQVYKAKHQRNMNRWPT